MSLMNVKLPSISIVELYKIPLYPPDLGNEPPVTENGGINTYNVLGGNEKAISIIVNHSQEMFISDSNLQFLTRILEACQLNLADISILNHATAKVTIESLKKQLKPRLILLFGLEPVAIGLPINFPLFKQQEFDGCEYLYVPPLNELNSYNESAKLLKSKLWVSLRKLFKV